jgi:hypothetical protein
VQNASNDFDTASGDVDQVWRLVPAVAARPESPFAARPHPEALMGFNDAIFYLEQHLEAPPRNEREHAISYGLLLRWAERDRHPCRRVARRARGSLTILLAPYEWTAQRVRTRDQRTALLYGQAYIDDRDGTVKKRPFDE